MIVQQCINGLGAAFSIVAAIAWIVCATVRFPEQAAIGSGVGGAVREIAKAANYQVQLRARAAWCAAMAAILQAANFVALISAPWP